MARVTFNDAIKTVRGALDSMKDGQARRARLICKWHYWGEKWIDEDGSKVHLVYTYLKGLGRKARRRIAR